MSVDWNESLGAAIESAAEALPEGYRLRLDIEKHGFAARLVLPDDIVADADRETLVDEIEALVEIAIKHSTEPKPLASGKSLKTANGLISAALRCRSNS